MNVTSIKIFISWIKWIRWFCFTRQSLSTQRIAQRLFVLRKRIRRLLQAAL